MALFILILVSLAGFFVVQSQVSQIQATRISEFPTACPKNPQQFAINESVTGIFSCALPSSGGCLSGVANNSAWCFTPYAWIVNSTPAGYFAYPTASDIPYFFNTNCSILFNEMFSAESGPAFLWGGASGSLYGCNIDAHYNDLIGAGISGLSTEIIGNIKNVYSLSNIFVSGNIELVGSSISNVQMTGGKTLFLDYPNDFVSQVSVSNVGGPGSTYPKLVMSGADAPGDLQNVTVSSSQFASVEIGNVTGIGFFSVASTIIGNLKLDSGVNNAQIMGEISSVTDNSGQRNNIETGQIGQAINSNICPHTAISNTQYNNTFGDKINVLIDIDTGSNTITMRNHVIIQSTGTNEMISLVLNAGENWNDSFASGNVDQTCWYD
jgi:hypothetical protein